MKFSKRLAFLVMSVALTFPALFAQTIDAPVSFSASCTNAIFRENFETGLMVNGGSDLYNGLPRNGSWQIVSSVNELGGGGYLPVSAPDGGLFLAAHTSNSQQDRIWYTDVYVMPGATYSFCMSATLLKNLGSGARYILGVYADGKLIGTGRVNFDWNQICGTFTAPQGKYKIELSVRDPKKGLFFVALDNICISSARPMADRQALATTVTAPAGSLNVFPNPAPAGAANIRYSAAAAGTVTVRVFDNMGRVVMSQKRQVTLGVNTIGLAELQGLNAGQYLVQVVGYGGVQSQKLMLTR